MKRDAKIGRVGSLFCEGAGGGKKRSRAQINNRAYEKTPRQLAVSSDAVFTRFN